MPSQEDINHQFSLLLIHRRNLAKYLEQQASGNIGLYITNGILSERQNIKSIKNILRGWHQVVGDHPDDVSNKTAFRMELAPGLVVIVLATEDFDQIARILDKNGVDIYQHVVKET